MVTNHPPQMKNSRNIMVHRRKRVILVTGCPRESPRCDALQVQPDCPRARAGDRLGDEAQAAQTLLYPGVISQRWLIQCDSAHVLHEATIDVRKGLEIALRMPGRHSGNSFSRGTQIALPGLSPLPSTTTGIIDECVWIVQVPLQARLGSIYSDQEPVFLAAGHLRTDQCSPGSATESQQNIGVVIQPPARDKGA